MIAAWWPAFDAFMTIAVPVAIGILVLGTLAYCLIVGLSFTRETTEWRKAITRAAMRGQIPPNDQNFVTFWPEVSNLEADSMTRLQADARLRAWFGTPEAAGRPVCRMAQEDAQ